MDKEFLTQLGEFSKVIADVIREKFDKHEAETRKLLDELEARVSNSLTVSVDSEAISTAVDEAFKAVHEHIDKSFEAISATVPKDGRDALQLEILPEIDIERSYPRNTYAKHNGGLWRSFEATAAMRGWECIVNGTAALDAALTDERLLTVTTRLSDGTEKSIELALPMLIDRGVYDSERPYTKGDGVTSNGSFWVAQDDAPAGRPGDDGSGWRLVVRKGRDSSSRGRESTR